MTNPTVGDATTVHSASTSHPTPTSPLPAAILAGGGEMGALMRGFDWASTPVGPVERWPQSLRTAVSILLDSRYPMYIAWGPEYVQFYNDAYAPVLGDKHPDALGRSTYDTWFEIWDDIVGPLFRKVKSEGEATYLEDFLFPMYRHGYTEECYFTFCYSAIREESGATGGVFVTCIETTARMLGERRLRTLRELVAGAAEARTPGDACRGAAAVLASNPHDVPFSAIYLVDDDDTIARLAGCSGLSDGHAAAPALIHLDQAAESPWPFAEVVRSAGAAVVEAPVDRVGPLPGGPWPEEPTQCAIVPVPRAGHGGLAAIIVVGLSARRALDDDYRGFLDLIAGHLARAIANARAYQEERKRAEALAEIDRAKTAFFSNVSHEFRTPLTLLLGPTEEVLADPAGTLDAGYRERLAVAHRNALRLLRLVNTLLDFSRIEAGRVDAVYQPTDLATLTAELVSGFRSAIERGGLRLAVECTPLDEPVYVDRDMWEKVVLNLLSNALKHTFEGEIGVVVRQVGTEAVLVVRDTGVGIPAEHLPRIFDRFHRVTGARSRTHEGSGIGLALVHELVRLHGGAVTVASEEGVGTTFTVSLPLGSAHLPAERIGAARTSVSTALGAAPFVEEALRWMPGGRGEHAHDGGTRAGDTHAAAAVREGSGPARILLADDNADMRDYVSRLLGERGWTVDAVADGRAALERAMADPPDLVVTDVMMPGLDGFALLRALRSHAVTRTIPVIVVSARAGEEAQVEGLDAGADDYLVKPFMAQELVARVNTHLTLARVRRDAEAEKTRLLEEANASRAEVELKADELQQIATELEMQSEELRATTDELQEANQIIETIQRVGSALASELDLSALVQTVTDETTKLTGARFGAFSYNVANDPNESYTLYAGNPESHLPVVSRLTVPVVSRSGEVLGGLFFGHEQPGVFTERHERIVAGIAGWAAVAIDNARLYERERRARGEAEAARRDAEHANRAKTEFLATMSHELRTPLNAIAGYVALLEMEIRGPITTVQREDLRRIQRSQQHLLSLINDILNFAKLEAGQVEFHLARVGLGSLLGDIEQLVGPQLAAKRLTFAPDECDDSLAVHADAEKARQILLNLLTNAVKFTEPGGRVVVRCTTHEGVIDVAITDTGRGIAPEKLDSIFEPFVQVDRHLTSAGQQGVGLGLAISRDLARAMGGDITVRSDVGSGSTFTLSLPRYPDQ